MAGYDLSLAAARVVEVCHLVRCLRWIRVTARHGLTVRRLGRTAAVRTRVVVRTRMLVAFLRRFQTMAVAAMDTILIPQRRLA